MTALVYKILTAAQWAAATCDGVFRGAPVDLADGYVHLSAADQVRETAARHFASAPDLVLAACDPASLGPALRWEASRGGALVWVFCERLPLPPGEGSGWFLHGRFG